MPNWFLVSPLLHYAVYVRDDQLALAVVPRLFPILLVNKQVNVLCLGGNKVDTRPLKGGRVYLFPLIDNRDKMALLRILLVLSATAVSV